MKIKVMHGRDAKMKSHRLNLANGATAHDALRALDLRPDMYIIVRRGTVIPLDEPLKNNDSIELLAVASGG